MTTKVFPIGYVSGSAPISCVDFFLPNNGGCEQIVAGDVEGYIYFWDLISMELRQKENVFPSGGCSWIKSMDGCSIAVQGRLTRHRDPGLLLLSKSEETWSVVWKSDLEHFHHDGFCQGSTLENLLAVPNGNSDIRLCTMAADSIKMEGNLSLDCKTYGNLMSLRITRVQDKVVLLAGCESGSILLWDWTKRQIISSFDIGPMIPFALDFDGGTSQGFIAGDQEYVISFSLEDDFEFKKLCQRDLPTQGISHALIRIPDKKIVMAASWDSTLRIFSWVQPKRLKPLGALKFHSETLEAVAFSLRPVLCKGSKLLVAAASKDKRISLWDIYN